MDAFDFTPEERVACFGIFMFLGSGTKISTNYKIVNNWIRILNKHKVFHEGFHIRTARSLLKFLHYEQEMKTLYNGKGLAGVSFIIEKNLIYHPDIIIKNINQGIPCVADFAFMSFALLNKSSTLSSGVLHSELRTLFNILLQHVNPKGEQWNAFNIIFSNYIKKNKIFEFGKTEYWKFYCQIKDAFDECLEFCQKHEYKIPDEEKKAILAYLSEYTSYRNILSNITLTNYPEQDFWSTIDFNDIVYYDKNSPRDQIISRFVD